jgi:hypothetical protein
MCAPWMPNATLADPVLQQLENSDELVSTRSCAVLIE